MSEIIKHEGSEPYIEPSVELESIKDIGDLAVEAAHHQPLEFRLSPRRLIGCEYLMKHEDKDNEYWQPEIKQGESFHERFGFGIEPTATDRESVIKKAREILDYLEGHGLGESMWLDPESKKSIRINFRLTEYGKRISEANIAAHEERSLNVKTSESYKTESIESLKDRLELMEQEIAHIKGEEYQRTFLDKLLSDSKLKSDNTALQRKLVSLVSNKEEELYAHISRYDNRRKTLVVKREKLEKLIEHAEGYGIELPEALEPLKQVHLLDYDQVDSAIACYQEFIDSIEKNKTERLSIPTSELVG